MQYRKLGHSGIEASVIGLGAWAIGGWMWGGTEKEKAISAIRAAVDQGINLIDTAPIYGFGHSEELVGEALKGIRDKAVLATKCGLVWDRQEGVFHFSTNEKVVTREGPIHVYKNLKPASIREEVEKSLRRLKTDYIDLYQTHWQEKSTPVSETMGELCKLRDEGKIRAIGVSNATPQKMREYQSTGSIDSDQEKYNMLDRDQDESNLPFCQKEGLAFLAYSPLAQGLLSGKMSPERRFADGDYRASMPRFSIVNRKEAEKMLELMRPIAERHDASLVQLAAAWAFHQSGCSHVLCGIRSPKQAEENAGAGSIRLTEEDLSELADILTQFQHIQ